MLLFFSPLFCADNTVRQNRHSICVISEVNATLVTICVVRIVSASGCLPTISPISLPHLQLSLLFCHPCFHLFFLCLIFTISFRSRSPFLSLPANSPLSVSHPLEERVFHKSTFAWHFPISLYTGSWLCGR